MNSKDKPKRGEAKTFVREIKPKSADKPAGKSGAKSGAAAKSAAGSFKKKTATKAVGPRDAWRDDKPVRAKRPAAVAGPDATAADGKPERISKILARAGVASRRDVERMILEGRVTLNGKLLETPVVNATLNDAIEVDGAPIRGIERTRLWLYHKPGGLVTTNSDPEGRPTVFDNLPEGLPRVLSIGRLDINTEGLLLLTNDGGLSRVLELPTTGWLRRYRVRAHGEVDQEALDKLKEGIAVDGVLYGSIDATLDRSQGRNVWITMGLREGKNREIKNVLGALGLEVNRLIRISYGPFQLGDLPEGEAIEVRGRTLRDQLGARLITEAKANFDAPLYNERGDEGEAPVRIERPQRDERSAQAEDGDGRRSFAKEDRGDDRREKALGRLDTRRDDRKFPDKKFADKPRGAKPFGSRDQGRDQGRDDAGDKKKRPPMGTNRTANVWMAPGARPTTESKTQKSSARAEAEQLFKKPTPENDRRVVINRTSDEEGEWIRAEGTEADRDDKRGFGRKSFGDKSYGDRGDRPRGERSFGDKPRFDRKPREDGERSERSFDKPRGERSFDKPRGERSFGDKPRFDRKPREDGDRSERPARAYGAGEGRSERPRSDRPYGDRPGGERAGGDRPRGERTFSDRPPRGDRPSGEGRPFGDKPRGKSFGGKPGGGKPGSGKPGGGKSFGGKPGGRPAGGKPGGRPAGGRPSGAGRGRGPKG